MTAFNAIPVGTVSFNDLQTEEGTPSVDTLHLKLSDDSDATWCGQIDDRSTNCLATFNISATMDNPVSINSISGTVRAQLSGTHNDDILQLYAKFTDSGGTVDLTSEEMYFDASTLGGTPEENTVAHTVLVTDAQQWTSNRMQLRWFYDRNKGADDIYIVVFEVEFNGDYTGAIGLESTQGLDSVGEVDKGAVVQIRELRTGVGLTHVNDIDKQPITHTHIVESVDLDAGGVIEDKNILRTHELESVLGLTHENFIDKGGVGTEHVLQRFHLNNTGVLDKGPVQQTYELEVALPVLDTENYIKSVTMVELVGYHYGPVLITIPGHILSTLSLTHITEIQQGAIATSHDTLAARDIIGPTVIQQGALVAQEHLLAANDIGATGGVEGAALVEQDHWLVSRDLDNSGRIESVALVDQVHQLATQDLTHVTEIQAVEMETLIVVPEFPDRTDYVGDVVDLDASTGWGNHDPDGFTATGLPPALSITPQGRVTGTLTTVGVYTTRIYNSTFFLEFEWTVIERPLPETGETHQQAINISISIGIGSTI